MLKTLNRKVKSLRKKIRPSTHNRNGYATATPTTDGKDIYAYFGNGLLYAITRKCQLVVIKTNTGEIVHEEKLDLGGTAYPSICSAGPYIFISSDTGKTRVIKPGIPPEKVGTNTLEKFRSTPVFANKRIYIRGLEHLYCIEAPIDM